MVSCDAFNSGPLSTWMMGEQGVRLSYYVFPPIVLFIPVFVSLIPI